MGETVYKDLIARGRSVKTARQWRSWTERLENVAGEKNRYERGDITEYLVYLRNRGISQNSINTMLRPLKLLCQIQNWPGGFPKLAMPKVRESDVNRPILSCGEIERMISRGKRLLDGRQLAFLALSTSYGLRREEMSRMRRCDLLGDKLRVDTAKGGPATVHLIPYEIRQYLEEFRRTDLRYMSRMFRSMCWKVGLRKRDGFGWHSIRRRLATELVGRGLSTLDVLRFMRWSATWMKGELSMLRIYVRREQADIDEQVFKVHPFLRFWR